VIDSWEIEAGWVCDMITRQIERRKKQKQELVRKDPIIPSINLSVCLSVCTLRVLFASINSLARPFVYIQNASPYGCNDACTANHCKLELIQ